MTEKYKKSRTFVNIMSGLSLLIPTFNDECLTLVSQLDSQCRAAGIPYEIIVADDGSTEKSVIDVNKGIDKLDNCHYIISNVNRGRAAIRNDLGRKAQYPWLLFIDSDMTVVSNSFITDYIVECERQNRDSIVLYGGYCVPEQTGLDNNLRYRYERACRNDHTAEKRAQNPYADFHTSNFMIRQQDFLAHPLDEHYRHYGYEDVAYGQTLRECGISILHIDNPLGFCRFESNEQFVAKTEEGLRTLAEFKDSLLGYSRLLNMEVKLKRMHIISLCNNILDIFKSGLRRNLTGDNPSLLAFKFYKLSYLLDQLKDNGKMSKRI